MPRGGLSSDPEKRERQLAGLRQNWPGKPAQSRDRGRKAEPEPAQTPEPEPAQPAESGRKRIADYPAESAGKKRSRARKAREPEPAPEPPRARGFLDGILGRY